MNASEVMLRNAVVLHPDMAVLEAMRAASGSTLDILPVVDNHGFYHGAVAKSVLVDHLAQPDKRVVDVCCTDAIVCAPNFALEHLNHDAQSPIPHQTIMVVGDDGRFEGAVPHVHWAVDEAKTQSGYPRNELGVRTVSMHLTWRCTECGELANRDEGLPGPCPACGADPSAISLYTED